jgi:hypothetical protein
MPSVCWPECRQQVYSLEWKLFNNRSKYFNTVLTVGTCSAISYDYEVSFIALAALYWHLERKI